MAATPETPVGGTARTDAVPPAGLPAASLPAPAGPTAPAGLTAPPRRGRVRGYFAEHPAVMDWVVVGSALFLSVPLIAEFTLHRQWWQLAVVVAQQFVLLGRRKWPTAVLALAVAGEAAILYSSPHSSITSVAVLFALYAFSLSVRALTAGIAAVVAALPAGVYYTFVYELAPEMAAHDADLGPAGIVAAVSILLLYVLAAGLGVWVKGTREHQTEIRAWAMRRAELASAQERNRIAREMHDVVAHSLTVMVALSDGAAKIAAKDAQRAQDVLGELSRTGRAALADMRRVLGVLREDGNGASRAPSPGTESLQSLVAGFRTAGLPAVLTLTGTPPPADAAFQLAVYRIVQESLTNALRYGRGLSRVDVAVVREGPAVHITVANDGGTPDAESAHLGTGGGIAGMRERAALYGGTLTAGPRNGGGWTVDAVLYWNEGDS